MRSLIETGAFCRGPDTRPGLMINGGACQGKTETACEALACYEDEWLALYGQNPSAVAGTLDLHVPAVYVRTPVKATPISACQRILHFYGERYQGMRLEDLIRTVKDAVFDHGTKAIVIDDITRLKMHREADQDVLDLIRELMSLPATLILAGVGIPKSGLLRDGRKDPRTGQWIFPPVKDRGKSRNDDAPGQTDLRFELIDLDRFSYAAPDGPAAWTAHLVGIEQQLRLLNGCDGMLSGGSMPEYLFGRTNGIIGLLKKLIQAGCPARHRDRRRDDHRRAPRHPHRQTRRPARTRPRRGRGPRHSPGTRPAGPETAQAAEHRIRRPGHPRGRSCGLTSDAPAPAATQEPGPDPRRIAARVPPSALLPAEPAAREDRRANRARPGRGQRDAHPRHPAGRDPGDGQQHLHPDDPAHQRPGRPARHEYLARAIPARHRFP